MLRFRFATLLVLTALIAPLASLQAQEKTRSQFEGFYTDVGFGYRNISASTNSVLMLNGSVIPSSISSSASSHQVVVLTTGYNLNISHKYFLGIGTNISPANGLAQQIQIQALNQTVTVSGIKSLYNYGFFISPGYQTKDGLIYLKAGKQTQVVNSNTGPNLNGYLLGLGYKQFVYESIYLFAEANYSFYDPQIISRTIVSSGRTISASITSSPQSTRLLLGLGYQF